MPTPVYLTGFEGWPDTPVTNGNGLCATVTGSPVVVTSQKNTGDRSLQILTAGAAENLRLYTISAGIRTFVGRIYVRFDSLPTGAAARMFTIGLATNGLASVGVDTSGRWFAAIGTGSTVTVTPGPSADGTWHRIDIRINSDTNHTLDWQINGVGQTQATSTDLAEDLAGVTIGPTSGATVEMYLDDVYTSHTSEDYPIGPGGTDRIYPESDGAHNAGANVIEDQAGNDIGVVTAYDKINSVPPDSTTYIQQLNNGTGNYAEVVMSNIVAAHSAILGARGLLAYTSAATQSNNGGLIMSKDNFSTFMTIWGAPGALSDYSDGSLSNLYYKGAILSDLVDDTTVNALKARMGYSGDASPDPYWIDVWTEVAYALQTNDIALDLVTYANTFPVITILESVIIPLDLVTYSSIFPEVSFVENVDIPLDLVTYSIVISDVTILENVTILLDLVTYSIVVPAITILENVILPLDSVAYINTFPAIEFLETGPILLDLVTYSSTIPALTILENVIEPLALVVYSFTAHPIEILEEGSIGLDRVDYLLNIHDLTIVESETIILDLVPYSVTVYDITILEELIIQLELVTYVSVVNDILFVSPYESLIVPLIRTYSIQQEIRSYNVEKETRSMSVNKEDRIYSIR